MTNCLNGQTVSTIFNFNPIIQVFCHLNKLEQDSTGTRHAISKNSVQWFLWRRFWNGLIFNYIINGQNAFTVVSTNGWRTTNIKQ